MVEETIDITLLNPFSGDKISLPPLMKGVPILEEEEEDEEPYDHKLHIKKAILTCDPSLFPKDYVVVAIYGDMQRLALFKSCDRIWTYFNPDRDMFSDVIFHDGIIFVIDAWMELYKVRFELTSSTYDVVSVAPRLARSTCDPIYECALDVYVSESSRGDRLFFIRRYGDMNDNLTHFKVYRLVYDGKRKRPKYLETKTLDDDVMFIGDNHSMCISSRDLSDCSSNCIYYTDDNTDYVNALTNFGYPNAGIYNVEDGSLHYHYKPDPCNKDLPPPIWIVPTLQ